MASNQASDRQGMVDYRRAASGRRMGQAVITLPKLAKETAMLALLFAITMIGTNPPDPSRAAADALKKHDHRIAGVSSFWGNMHTRNTNWRHYGLKCAPLTEDAYAYGYFVSDAVGQEAFDGYRKQIDFLTSYNKAMLKSGTLPRAWNCTADENPGPLG